MGILGQLISSILGVDNKGASTTQKSRPRSSNVNRHNLYNPGDVLSGKVARVADKFAKVVSGDLTAIVFPAEMDDGYVENPSDILTIDKRVDFVLLENNVKGWVASIRAVPEAKARAALESVEEGDVITGKIIDLQPKGVIIECGNFTAWVSLSDLAWKCFDHPGDAVALGQSVDAEIIRIERPENWLNDRRARRARAVASIRACIEKPESPIVSVPYSAMPFKLWAVVRSPAKCDPVSLFVLEEVSNKRSRDDLANVTGLPVSSLDKIHKLLEEESLVKNWGATENGSQLVAAMRLVRELHDSPIRGFYASAAPVDKQFITLDEHESSEEYPRGWPKPPYDARKEREFSKAADEALPELMVKRMVPESMQALVSCLQQNKRISVFLRREGGRPWKGVYVNTPEYWVLEGLWRFFVPAFGDPERPAPSGDYCNNFLLIRCDCQNEQGVSVGKIWFEPATRTGWWINGRDGVGGGEKMKVKEYKHSVFPVLPSIVEQGIKFVGDEPVCHLEAEAWCLVRGW